MAADIALKDLACLQPGSLVLDPMMGSGTVIRTAAEEGHRALGFDMDPLAVLMAKVWTTPIDAQKLRRSAARVALRAGRQVQGTVPLPWIDDDPETRDFIGYWFGERQQADLRKLAALLHGRRDTIGNALKLALSRIIVTKDRGASLARDVSHSRPHRVQDENSYPVISEFVRSAERLARQFEEQPPPGGVTTSGGDARRLRGVVSSSVDAVVTSPPYLNAIDYLRAHRLALVWLGHRVGDLRTIRAQSIGAERGPDTGSEAPAVLDRVASSLGSLDRLPRRIRRMIDRYVLDLLAVMTELHRVLRPGGKATLVIGNSTLRGVFVANANAVMVAAGEAGFTLVSRKERDLPPARRYLPPPTNSHDSDLEKRMRTEVVLTFLRP
jgi:hypothetical protein